MTTIAQIITDAYRESNLIARGATETAEEQIEALRLLDRYIQSLFGNEAGDNLEEKLFGKNNVDLTVYDDEFENFVRQYYMPSGYRIKLNLEAAQTIRLDPNPENGAIFGIVDASNNLATYPLTIEGNGSRIDGGTSTLINTNGTSALWFYRADIASWQIVSDLAVTDESPFPKEFDDLLIVGLAMRLDPRNGAGISQFSTDTYLRTLKKFRARYSQVVQKPVDWALAQIDGHRRYWRGYSLTGEFERGTFRRW